jgi:hypothetical protein
LKSLFVVNINLSGSFFNRVVYVFDDNSFVVVPIAIYLLLFVFCGHARTETIGIRRQCCFEAASVHRNAGNYKYPQVWLQLSAGVSS